MAAPLILHRVSRVLRVERRRKECGWRFAGHRQEIPRLRRVRTKVQTPARALDRGSFSTIRGCFVAVLATLTRGSSVTAVMTKLREADRAFNAFSCDLPARRAAEPALTRMSRVRDRKFTFFRPVEKCVHSGDSVVAKNLRERTKRHFFNGLRLVYVLKATRAVFHSLGENIQNVHLRQSARVDRLIYPMSQPVRATNGMA